MGKRLSKVGAWFGVKFDKIVKLSDMERVDHALNQLHEKYSELNDNYAMARGGLRIIEQDIVNCEKSIAKVKNAARILKVEIERNQDNQRKVDSCKDQLQILRNNLNGLEQTLQTHEATKEIQEKVVAQIEAVRNKTKAKLDEVQNLRTQLEIKSKFTDTMKKYESFMVEGSDLNIDDALRNIDIKFEASNFKYEDMSAEVSVDDILRNDQSDLDDWLNNL